MASTLASALMAAQMTGWLSVGMIKALQQAAVVSRRKVSGLRTLTIAGFTSRSFGFAQDDSPAHRLHYG